MKSYVNIEKLIKTFEDMANRESLLAHDGISQQDLLIQITGTIVRTAMEDDSLSSKEFSIYIIDLFEKLLDIKNIEIPCEDENEEKQRHEDKNSAKIYGTEYYLLRDNIERILDKLLL